MSRIGKLPIVIPKEVKVKIKDNTVTVEGPNGRLDQSIRPAIQLKIKDDQVWLTRIDDSKQSKAYHGLYRSIIFNMMIGRISI